MDGIGFFAVSSAMAWKCGAARPGQGIIQKELEQTAALLGLSLALQNPRQSCFNAKFPAAASAGFFVCYRTGTAELVKRFLCSEY
ncbi:hypothetical protein [Rhizobium mesoamericanum]|nr:hypothetical protein [Rhizobium mesoamericanum]